MGFLRVCGGRPGAELTIKLDNWLLPATFLPPAATNFRTAPFCHDVWLDGRVPSYKHSDVREVAACKQSMSISRYHLSSTYPTHRFHQQTSQTTQYSDPAPCVAGQSQPPNHLSMFLEVTDSQANPEWSCFVSHRLSVVNQRADDKSVAKESQNRYSKQVQLLFLARSVWIGRKGWVGEGGGGGEQWSGQGVPELLQQAGTAAVPCTQHLDW